MLPLKPRQRMAVVTGFLAFGLTEIAAALFTKMQPAHCFEESWTATEQGVESLYETIA
jgi:hypothetical protein